MRGGVRPILIWLAILFSSATLNAIWTGDLVQIGMFVIALGTVGSLVIGVIVANPDALRRGEPGPRGPEVVVRRSFAAFFLALGFAVFVFGWTFGRFPLLVGGGMMIAGIGRLVGEWRAQRQAVRAR
ncbi:MAG TPA: hypothetical protein VFN48_07600 [Solirubrobacteraceae bacterium]|nr:hypothetical protein [Solirubrobacteraceae bacterium]